MGGRTTTGRADPWTVFALTATATLITSLDLSIVNVAFTDIRRSFTGASNAGVEWVVTGYAITFASLLVVGGRTADRVGRKKVFLAGTAAFMVGSAFCSFAPTLHVLVAGRMFQGCGAAFLAPATLGLLLPAFSEDRRTQIVALWTGVGALGVALGPTLGAVLIDATSWRAAFVINLPLCAVLLVAGHRVLDESARQTGPLPDYTGAALLTFGLSALILGISNGGTWGWLTLRTAGAFVTSAVMVTAALLRSARHPSPIIDLGLFREPTFATATGASLVFSIGFSGAILANPLFLRSIQGFSVVRAGMWTVLSPVSVAVVSGWAGRRAARIGFRPVLLAGTAIYAFGMMWLATHTHTDTDFLTDWLPGILANGIGAGLTFPVLGAAAVRRLRADEYALGSAVNTTARQVGAAVGVAVVIAILGADPDVAAFHRAWAFAAVLTIASGLVSSRQP